MSRTITANATTVFEDSDMESVERDRKTGKTKVVRGKLISNDKSAPHIVKFGNGVYELHGWTPPESKPKNKP